MSPTRPLPEPVPICRFCESEVPSDALEYFEQEKGAPRGGPVIPHRNHWLMWRVAQEPRAYACPTHRRDLLQLADVI